MCFNNALICEHLDQNKLYPGSWREEGTEIDPGNHNHALNFPKCHIQVH